MAISKRTRYEVLRRDEFTCRYCGGKSPEVELHVDHVNPVALGGTDSPDNLVAACRDCNLGKASTSPSEGTVSAVAKDAERWARAIEEASQVVFGTDDATAVALELFTDEWSQATAWHGGLHSLPDNWAAIIVGYVRRGLPDDQIANAARIAINARGVNSSARFPYFCGVCRNRLERVEEAARAIINGGE